jgi:hypothetical protein
LVLQWVQKPPGLRAESRDLPKNGGMSLSNVLLPYRIPMPVGPHICSIHEESSAAQKAHADGNLQNRYTISNPNKFTPKSLILYTEEISDSLQYHAK